MNYWSKICFLIRFSPVGYIFIKLAEAFVELFYGRSFSLSISIQTIILLILIQIILIIFFRTVDISSDRLTILKFKNYSFLDWSEIKELRRIHFIVPITYLVQLKDGLPFFFITPEASIHYLFMGKAYGPIADLIDKIKFNNAI